MEAFDEFIEGIIKKGVYWQTFFVADTCVIMLESVIALAYIVARIIGVG